jgi:hypothetical protein
MTTPDIAAQCERLRPRPFSVPENGFEPVVVEPSAIRIEAADTIERQAAEIERLRGALTMAKGPLGSTGPTPVYEAVLAALTGEDA